MTLPMALRTACVLAAAFVSACGGGGTNDGGDSTPQPMGGGTGSNLTGASVTYQSLSSTAAATSALAGAAIQSNGSTGTVSIVGVQGSLTHDTGATTVSYGLATVTDPDGPDANGNLTDGTTTITPVTTGFSGTYEYVRAFSNSYASGGTNFDVPVGVVGVATQLADVPNAGTATYVGDASGVVVSGEQGFDLRNGQSVVTADFGAGSVNVETSGFSAVNQSSGQSGSAPIDTVSVTGMSISGSGFSGGTVATSLNGTAVTVTGANTSSSASGNFFGFDGAINFPDEVGGVIVSQGDSGLVGVGFAAD